MISGHLGQTFSGCYDRIPSVRDEAFGFIYRKDPKTNNSIYDSTMNIKIEENAYQALVFVTDRLSLPDSWIR